MSTILTESEAELWSAFLKVHNLVTRAVGRELERSHGISAPMIDVLVTLTHAPRGCLRMSALTENVLLSPSGLTRVVESLRKKGYVRRRVDPRDRRSVIVSLTPEGREVRQKAQGTVRRCVANYLLREMTPAEKDVILTAFRRILQSTGPEDQAGRAGSSPAAVPATAARS